ncbi:hypothetical protein [Liquorilactobacillus oeni]|nr:hypothetical protein [Liquorilactobacillus oeni]
MAENILFNPGQMISSSYDYEEAYLAAKIYRKKTKHSPLIVQTGKEKLYYVFDKEKPFDSNQQNKEYRIVKYLENEE